MHLHNDQSGHHRVGRLILTTPDLHLDTCFVRNDEGRILSTREPHGEPGPLLIIVRGMTSCAWAVRADVSREISSEIHRIAQREPPASDFRAAPVHAQRYISLLWDRIGSEQRSPAKLNESDGPAFVFPASLPSSGNTVVVEDEQLLEHNFRGWVPGEIAAGRAPVLAIIEDDHPVSVCFCARRSESAAEAGVETAEMYRGRGYGGRVTSAWADAIRNSGRTPLYSTSWSNNASLAVARKLGLIAYASSWSLYE